MVINRINNAKIETAIILAAGNGTRLLSLTEDIPKCLLKINGQSILHRLIDILNQYKIKRIIIVVGYLADKIVEFIQEINDWEGIRIEFVINELHSTTNNIYSLWLAQNLINEPFLLLESDIVFDPFLLKELLKPDRIALADYDLSMSGTTVDIDTLGIVKRMYIGEKLNESVGAKKTINIYSFSLSSWRFIKQKLNQRINKELLQDYYEIVFSTLIDEGNLILFEVNFDAGRWCEVDTLDDLNNTEKLFRNENIIGKG